MQAAYFTCSLQVFFKVFDRFSGLSCCSRVSVICMITAVFFFCLGRERKGGGARQTEIMNWLVLSKEVWFILTLVWLRGLKPFGWGGQNSIFCAAEMKFTFYISPKNWEQCGLKPIDVLFTDNSLCKRYFLCFLNFLFINLLNFSIVDCFSLY